MNWPAYLAVQSNPKAAAYIRQAKNEIARCATPANTWHTRTEWKGITRGLHMAGKLTQDLRDLIDAAIDDAVTQHTERLSMRASTRVDEE